MAESFQKLLESLQAEISNLRGQVSSGSPTALKDLSLISLIPKWSGTEKSVSVKEFFELVESSARIGNWSEFDKIQITVLKIAEAAKAFYSSSPELQNTCISWEHFEAKFLHRFRDFRSDQYHFMQLQTAKQKKHETAQEFLDRWHSLAMKTVPKERTLCFRNFIMIRLNGCYCRHLQQDYLQTQDNRLDFKLQLQCLRQKHRRKEI